MSGRMSAAGVRVPFDADAYAARVAEGCFVCRIVGDPANDGHFVVAEDDEHMVFLNRNPTTPGQLLVAPRRHVERLEIELDGAAWSRLQAVVHRAARALAAVVPCDRVYTASLGSREGNAHLHVHVVAVPPGIPADRQQLVLLDAERSGVVRLPAPELDRLALALRAALTENDSRETEST